MDIVDQLHRLAESDDAATLIAHRFVLHNAAEEILKITQPLPGERLRVCTNVADFAQRIVFRPDGRIVRNTPVTDLDQITVSDDLGDGDTSNDKIRSIFFGASGRMTTMDQNGGANGGAACP